jgi:amidase
MGVRVVPLGAVCGRHFEDLAHGDELVQGVVDGGEAYLRQLSLGAVMDDLGGQVDVFTVEDLGDGAALRSEAPASVAHTLQEITDGGILPGRGVSSRWGLPSTGVGARDDVFLERWSRSGTGPTVAVKDLVDVEGSVTTAGCLALARTNDPAPSDGACVAAVRRGGGVLVGKTNLHELAYGTSGVNPWFGTPPNPADPGRVPGGSSSGSAVAAAVGDCDVALGADTGGSIRIPAACCGVVGLKTTTGRIPLDGVWPLAPSLDTVGPLARSVSGVALGLALLEGRPPPDVVPVPDLSVGRARLGPEVEIDPVIDEAVDRALAASELTVAEVAVEGWLEAWKAHMRVLDAEAWASDRELFESDPDGIGDEVRDRLEAARRRSADAAALAGAREMRASFTAAMGEAVGRHGFLALPTLPWRPPSLGERWRGGFNLLTAPVNFCGFPAVSVPVPVGVGAGAGVRADGWRVTGLQLVGPPGADEALLALASVVEEAVGWTA